MSIEERVTKIERKLACLEQKFQDRPLEEPSVRKLTADISILSHIIVAIVNDLHDGSINTDTQYLSEAKRYLTAAKEAILRSQSDSE